MKKLLKYLAYLPVILVAMAATAVLSHMVRVTEERRARVHIKANRDKPTIWATPSPDSEALGAVGSVSPSRE
jgi:hypothetical protein